MGNQKLESLIVEYVNSLDPAKLGFMRKEKLGTITERKGSENDPFLEYFFTYDEKPFMFRINKAREDNPEISRRFKSGYDKLVALKPFNISATPYLIGKGKFPAPFMITEFIEGEPINPQNFERAIESMKILSALPLDKIRFKDGFKTEVESCFDYAINILDRYSTIVKGLTKERGESNFSDMLSTNIERAKKYIQKNGGLFEGAKMTLVHKKIPESMILTPSEGIKLINWRNSEVGDPAYDASLILGPQGVAGEKIHDLIRAYNPNDKTLERRIKLYDEVARIEGARCLITDLSERLETNPSQETRAHYQRLILDAMKHIGECDFARDSNKTTRVFKNGLEDFLKPRQKEVYVKPAEPEKPAEGALHRAGRYISNGLKIAATAATLYSSGYIYSRMPVVLSTEQEEVILQDGSRESVPVKFIGQRWKNFPGNVMVKGKPLDDWLWHAPETKTTSYSNGQVEIDMDTIQAEKNAETIQKNWDEKLKNKESCEKDGPCDMVDLALVYSLGKIKREEVSKAFLRARYASDRVHESKHAVYRMNDWRIRKTLIPRYSQVQEEEIAFLTEAAYSDSPIVTHKLEKYIDPIYTSFVKKEYPPAAKNAFECMINEGKVKQRKQLYSLSQEKFKKAARSCLEKAYKLR